MPTGLATTSKDMPDLAAYKTKNMLNKKNKSNRFSTMLAMIALFVMSFLHLDLVTMRAVLD